jgi:DNA polymerase III epsilon subunit-like protein
MPLLPMDQALDTLAIARRRFPGSPASLDALCRRFGIDNTARTLHGALLDSEILAEVYLELIGGRQPDFGLSADTGSNQSKGAADDWRPMPRSAAQQTPRAISAIVCTHWSTAYATHIAQGRAKPRARCRLLAGRRAPPSKAELVLLFSLVLLLN